MTRTLLALSVSACVLGGCIDTDASLSAFCAARPSACDGGMPVMPVCPASDEFDGPELHPCFKQYSEVVPATSVPVVSSGSLVLLQQQGPWTWSNGSVGGLVSQELTGAFVVEVRAHARKLDAGQQFDTPYVGAGIVATDPERLLTSRLISIGGLGRPLDGGAIPNGALVEVNEPASSVFLERAEGYASASLRLCRYGPRQPDGGSPLGWAALYRNDDLGPWIRFTPPPNMLTLPDRVAVGPATYAVGANEQHRMTFEYFRVKQSDLNAEVDCAQVFDGGR